jgi:tetratricopeptide (TPR) repeat protein
MTMMATVGPVLVELVAPGMALLHRKFLSAFPASLFQSCPPGRCPGGVCELSEDYDQGEELGDRKCGRCLGMMPWLLEQDLQRVKGVVTFHGVNCGELFDARKGPFTLLKLFLMMGEKRDLLSPLDVPALNCLEVVDKLQVFVECFGGFGLVELDLFRAWVFAARRAGLDAHVNSGVMRSETLGRALVGLLGCKVVAETCPSAARVRAELVAEIEKAGWSAADVSITRFVGGAEGGRINNLRKLFMASEMVEPAIARGRENLAIAQAIFPAGHLATARPLMELAETLKSEKKYKRESEEIIREAVKILRAAHPAQHEFLADALLTLSMIVYENKDESTELIREAQRNFESVIPPVPQSLGECLYIMGTCEMLRKNFEESIPHLERALAIYKAIIPPPEEAITQTAQLLVAAKARVPAPAPAKPVPSRPHPAKEKEKRPAVSQAERERLERELLEDDGDNTKDNTKRKGKRK